MSKGKDLVKNTAILMAAKLATHFVSFFLMPLYTAILSTEEYGESDVYSTLATILLPFFTLQIEMSLFRFFISDKDEAERKKTVTSAFCISGICLGAAAVIYLAVSAFVTVKYRFVLLLFYSSLTLLTLLLQTARAKGDNICYGTATFLSSFISILLNLLLVAWLRYGVVGILSAQIISNVITSCFILIRTRILRYFRISILDYEKSIKMLKYSTPLILNQISSWVINYSDRLIILKLLNIGMNGIYAVANKFSNILAMLFNMYMVAWTENIVRTMDSENNEQYLSKVIGLSFNAYLIVITGIINLMPFVFGWLINEAFADAYPHIPLLLFSTFFYGMAAMIGSIYVAYGKTKSVSITTAVSALINVTVHISLVRIIGLYAASVSTIVSFILLFIYRLIDVQKFCPIRIELKKVILPLAIVLVSCAAYWSQNTVYIIIGLLLNLLDLTYIAANNKQMLISMLNRKNHSEKGE